VRQNPLTQQAYLPRSKHGRGVNEVLLGQRTVFDPHGGRQCGQGSEDDLGVLNRHLPGCLGISEVRPQRRQRLAGQSHPRPARPSGPHPGLGLVGGQPEHTLQHRRGRGHHQSPRQAAPVQLGDQRRIRHGQPAAQHLQLTQLAKHIDIRHLVQVACANAM
jgi:hypothetical protein